MKKRAKSVCTLPVFRNIKVLSDKTGYLLLTSQISKRTNAHMGNRRQVSLIVQTVWKSLSVFDKRQVMNDEVLVIFDWEVYWMIRPDCSVGAFMKFLECLCLDDSRLPTMKLCLESCMSCKICICWRDYNCFARTEWKTLPAWASGIWVTCDSRELYGKGFTSGLIPRRITAISTHVYVWDKQI